MWSLHLSEINNIMYVVKTLYTVKVCKDIQSGINIPIVALYLSPLYLFLFLFTRPPTDMMYLLHRPNYVQCLYSVSIRGKTDLCTTAIQYN